MRVLKLAFTSFATVALALTPNAGGQSTPHVSSATLPIVFTHSIRADRAHAGDVVYAKTVQVVRLGNGDIVPVGTKLAGRVLQASSFDDSNAHAGHDSAVLAIRFNALQFGRKTRPIQLRVRAVADPITSAQALDPLDTELDPLSTLTQIGGDQLTPSQSEVINFNGEVVGHNRRSKGVYARLVSSAECSGTDIEVAVGNYSAAACGLYGFPEISISRVYSGQDALVLTSSSRIPEISRNSTALLEEVNDPSGDPR